MKAPLAAAAALLPVLALAGAELRLRAARGAPPEEPITRNYRYSHLDIHEPYFKREGLGGGKARYDVARPESQAKAFEDPKPQGGRRVFIVGGSVVLPFAHAGGELFKALFARALPGAPLQLVSCGMGGYDSWRDSLVAEEIVRYSPDLVVVLSGNNEYYAEFVPFPRLALMTRALRRLWLFRLLQERLASKPKEGAPWDPDRRLARARRFEANLRAMVRAAKSRKVPIVLCTLPANLRDSAPTGGPIRLPLEDHDFFLAWAKYDAGAYAAAEKAFSSFSAKQPAEAFAHFYRAKSLDRLGRRAQAAEEYRLAADANDPGERTSPARNAIIRRVAKEEGALLADLERAFSAAAPAGVPGREMFRDPCHFRVPFYALASSVILEAWTGKTVSPDGVSAPGADPSVERAEIVYSAIAKSFTAPQNALWDEAVNMFQVSLETDPKLVESVVWSDARLAEVFDKPWFAEFKTADLGPLRHQVMIHLAEAYRRMGRPQAALRCYDAAERSKPGGYQAALGRAVTLARLGRKAESRAALERLKRDWPDRKGPVYWAEALE